MSLFTVYMILTLFIVALISYLIGSIPTGYLIVKSLTKQDLLEIGSGSTGATNVKRVLGKKWFITVMLLDALKGALPVILTLLILQNTYWDMAPVVAALFVLIGHSKSIFLKFKGGKAVASGVGAMLALCFPVGIIVAIIWAIITYFSKYVSLGSVVAIALSPWLMFAFKQPYPYILFCVFGAMLIVWLHRDNIKRLTEGTENKVR